MKLHFSIDYYTHWGESVHVLLKVYDTNGKVQEQLVPLATTDGQIWKGELIYTQPDALSFEYQYCICYNNQIVKQEWSQAWRHYRVDMNKDYFLPDCWQNVPSCNHLYTAPFVSGAVPMSQNSVFYDRTLILCVQAPQVADDEMVGVLGNMNALGNWQPERAVPMTASGLHEWTIALSADGMNFPFEYKYVILDKNTRTIKRWEEGENRVSLFRGVERNQILAHYDGLIHLDFERRKLAGVVIPLFSIRTGNTWGVGDFTALKSMIDWAASVDMQALQLLPVYDTNTMGHWTDSYPYNCISVYALHLQYLDMTLLPPLADHNRQDWYAGQAAGLNRLPVVDYEGVMRLKRAFLEESYAQDGAAVLATEDYQSYFESNSFWLIPYAAYSYLKELYGTPDFTSWPEYQEYDAHKIYQLVTADPHVKDRIGMYYYAQYQLYRQMTQAHDYARTKGILLKGDIPIGVSRNAVDVWMEPYYFNLNGQAGAPPDAFSEVGQNWGFPTYNWETILQDQCKWWTRRLEKMAEFFDAYRIDHVLGFFRIWEIPTHAVNGLLGYFVPALPLSVAEIQDSGLEFRKDFYTRPYISEWILNDLFDERKETVKETFLVAVGYDWYELRPEFATERQVERYFEERRQENGSLSPEDRLLKQGLFQLISNVLFVEDPRKQGYYHPRISAQNTYIYQTLTQKEKEAFDRLYQDFFYHRHNHFWYGTAMQKLPRMIASNRMLPCAEDLGMVPECVKWVLQELQILTLEIQTMPKELNRRFAHLEENPYQSVATIFTHDMPTLRSWWKEDEETTAAYFHEILQKDGMPPADIPGWLCEEIVARHLFSPSMLCLISWQDWMAMDDGLRNPDIESERINVPSNPRHYWQYRMHLQVEELMQAEDFNQKIRTLIHRSGRNRA